MIERTICVDFLRVLTKNVERWHIKLGPKDRQLNIKTNVHKKHRKSS